jgi:hypothetical protein
MFEITSIPVAPAAATRVEEVEFATDTVIGGLSQRAEIEAAERARKEEAEKMAQRRSRARTRTILPGQRVPIDVVIPKESFLRGRESVGVLKARYAARPKRRTVPTFVPPGLAELGVRADTVVSKADEASIKRSIEKASSYVQDSSWPEEELPTTDSIVSATLEQMRKKGITNFNNLCGVSWANPMRWEAFLQADRPVMDFQTAMMDIQQGLMAKMENVFHSDDLHAVSLARLFASLLLNGLRDPAGLIPALRELQFHHQGTTEALAQAALTTDPYAQASIVAVALLNTSAFIAFFRHTRKRHVWRAKHYRPSAQIRSIPTITFTIDILLTIALRPVDFAMDLRPDLLSQWSNENLERFVTWPAFAHLDMDEVNSHESLVAELTRQIAVGSKHRGKFQLPFQRGGFIHAVIAQPGESREWQEFATAAKKSAGPEQLFAEGIERRCLPRWLMILIMSDQVEQYYYPYASFADPFRAKYIVEATVRIVGEPPEDQ